ncbi:arginine--tRNA ligase [Metabacillus fastidiosus]|uniref:arginine--tRNA ligase n=1 Tax=Metabacillus fastidiosus TaxID=1458 RepID=UPI003D26F1BD
MYKDIFIKSLSEVLNGSINIPEVQKLIEKPKNPEHGDFAFPCFSLAKKHRKSPQLIAKEISDELSSPFFEKAESVGGYVNVFLNKKIVIQEIIKNILTEKNKYGALEIGNNQVVTIDMSSPNIAKPFSMGHLRSTVIGNALANIYSKCGYKPVKVNHLGDWGTQFGKLITAYLKWGDEVKVKANPIKELTALYVKFHDESEKDPILDVEARKWFKCLEDGDKQALELWKWFRDESLKDFSRIYDLLGISFDSFAGEAFYNDKMEEVIELLEKKDLLTNSDNAVVVQLGDDMPPCLIKKSDGATLYATRDLAAAIYRKNHYNFALSMYVVGGEQSLHFKQIKTVLERMEYNWFKDIIHVPFGMILKDGKKMSTRKGQVVLLEEVLKDAILLAEQDILTKNPGLSNKSEVAKQVGVGAIIFQDLKNYRMNDIEFSLEDVLRFEGETGPYVQYSFARACSLLRKGEFTFSDSVEINLSGNKEWGIISLLLAFPEVIETAMKNFDPSQVAKYTINLAQAFNKYYAEVKILTEDDQKNSRLQLVAAVAIVLKEGLNLLGISAPEEM